jgi:NADPH-dependent FMN reductase
VSVAVVVGNPKLRSRTYEAAHIVAERLAGRPADLSIDLAELGPALLDWSDPGVAELVAAVQASDLVVVASPTYKATYTGLLKLARPGPAASGGHPEGASGSLRLMPPCNFPLAKPPTALLLEGVLDFLSGVLQVAFGLIGLTFSLQGGIPGGFPGAFLKLAGYLLG